MSRILVLGLSSLLFGILQAPGVPAEPSPTESLPSTHLIALHLTGVANSQVSELPVFVLTADLYSLVTGEFVGIATNRVRCGTSCTVAEVETTYRLPQGDLLNRSRVSVVPDPQRAGFALTGARPDDDTIVSGTGGFEGRTGRVHISGLDDMTKFPLEVGFDSFHVIRLDPQ